MVNGPNIILSKFDLITFKKPKKDWTKENYQSSIAKLRKMRHGKKRFCTDKEIEQFLGIKLEDYE